MGCVVTHNATENGLDWCLVEQLPSPTKLQLIEIAVAPISDLNKKINCHIAFTAKNPAKEMAELTAWAKDSQLKFISGQWSEKEMWFDLPEIFVNFVIEIIATSVTT